MGCLGSGHMVTEVTFERRAWWAFWRWDRVVDSREVMCYCGMAG